MHVPPIRRMAEDKCPAAQYHGTIVKWFAATKYGYIQDGEDRYMVEADQMKFQNPKVGDSVTFEVQETNGGATF